ncbi:MAG: hypothetical protein IT322_19700 [Anaerolineae bacterium]|nr:hypothetical protein [Anaerolineae bacterium]
MRTLFTSQYRAVLVSVIGVIATGLALVVVMNIQGVSERTIAASLLILSFMVFGVGGVLFTGRAFLKWQIGETSSHLIWERSFVIGGILFTVLGLALLEDMLHAAGEPALSRLGMLAYLFGAVIAVIAETTYLAKHDWVYPQIVLYVVLAFLAQAAFGASLLQTGLVAGWVGWVTIIWNLAWLPVLIVFSRRNIYFPALHHAAPLLIGIALLVG